MLISIVTPIYNRAEYVHKLANSISNQTHEDIEWFLIDDGSIDDIDIKFTETINKYPNLKRRAKLIKKENGGKHTAVNLGVGLCKGELTVIWDSDDTASEFALEKISKKWEEIKSSGKENEYWGVICLDVNNAVGKIVGKSFPAGKKDFYLSDLFKYKGDKWRAVITEVLIEYPFPEYRDERFVTEMLVWMRMCKYKKGAIINEPLYFHDYLSGGLTSRYKELLIGSPKAAGEFYKELLGVNEYSLSYFKNLFAYSSLLHANRIHAVVFQYGGFKKAAIFISLYPFYSLVKKVKACLQI